MALSLQNIQSLLQSTLGNECTVESYTEEKLLPPGENYGSIMASINSIIKKLKHGKCEELQLVAKSAPPIEMQQELKDGSVIFRKEIFMYSTMIPSYRKLEIDNGVGEEDALELSPRYYGSMVSSDSEKSGAYDAIILLENLKPKGYYCVDRRFGCDLAHAKLVVKTIARFHALGMATKEKNPDFFEILKRQAQPPDIANVEVWQVLCQQRIDDITDNPELKEYHEASRQALSQSIIDNWKIPIPEPWSTITHADLWTNNIMFRNNNEGAPEDIKLVDFQLSMFASPMRDLTFFLTAGLDLDTTDHIDELIDLYYDTLIGRLNLLGCNIEPYTRRSFDEKLREDAYVEFVHSVVLIKIVTQDIFEKNADVPDLKDVLQSRQGNVIYNKRLRKLVQTFGKKGWFKK